MKVKPLNDWAVIIPDDAEVRSAGGIYIPDTAKDKPAEGVVEAIGPGAYEEERMGGRKERDKKDKKERKFIPTSVKSGDHVLYEKYAGQRITVGSQERVLVRERNILGLLPARQKSAEADLPPLQFPLVAVKPGERSLMKRGVTAVALSHQHKAGALKPAAKKAEKKAAKKAVKKKSVKKAAKKAAKKVQKKSAKKAVNRPSTKTAASTRKKAVAKKARKKR